MMRRDRHGDDVGDMTDDRADSPGPSEMGEGFIPEGYVSFPEGIRIVGK